MKEMETFNQRQMGGARGLKHQIVAMLECRETLRSCAACVKCRDQVILLRLYSLNLSFYAVFKMNQKILSDEQVEYCKNTIPRHRLSGPF